MKMNLAHLAASRSRSFESGVISHEPVSYITPNSGSSSSSFSPYAWKRTLEELIESDVRLKGAQVRYVLTILIRHADNKGQTWLSQKSIMSRAGIGSLRTLRSVLDLLVETGWLHKSHQTWTSLTEVQVAAGKKTPRRGDAGQAPNLYIVLDGRGQTVTNETYPNLVRTTVDQPGPSLARATSPSTHGSIQTPVQNSTGGPVQNSTGGPGAKQHVDLDHVDDLQRIESVERARRVDTSTHISSKSSKKDQRELDAWKVIVEAHVDKTKAVYGLAPMAPDLKRPDRQALVKCLDGAAVEVRAQLHTRTGIEHDLADVQRDLATRTMHLYFKNDNPHLRRVKHALRDLPREFHARLTEAMQARLRESHDAAPPRRVQLEQPQVRVASVDKPAEEAKQKQHEVQQKNRISADKPAPVECVESADKPANVAPSKASEPASPPPPKPSSASLDTAREARKLLEALGVTSPQQELFKSSQAEPARPKQPTRPSFSERKQAELEQTRASADKPAPVRKSFEQKPLEDKPSSTPPRGPQVERPLGRSGAPRWGAVGPRPVKVRRAPKLVPDDVESGAGHGDSSATKT